MQVQPELFLVGILDGKIVATVMAGYDGHRGSVYYLAVDPNHQRRNYGTRLMEEVMRLLTEMGCPKINLLVRSSNAGVIDFYRKIGFAADDVVSLGKLLVCDERPGRDNTL